MYSRVSTGVTTLTGQYSPLRSGKWNLMEGNGGCNGRTALAKWFFLMCTRTSFLPGQCFLTFFDDFLSETCPFKPSLSKSHRVVKKGFKKLWLSHTARDREGDRSMEWNYNNRKQWVLVFVPVWTFLHDI